MSKSRWKSCWPPRCAIASCWSAAWPRCARARKACRAPSANSTWRSPARAHRLRALKAAAGEAAQTLDERLKRARLHIDELSVLTASGERIADRIERGVATAPPSAPLADIPLPSASIMNRLDAMREPRNDAFESNVRASAPAAQRDAGVRRPSGAERHRALCMTPCAAGSGRPRPTPWRPRPQAVNQDFAGDDSPDRQRRRSGCADQPVQAPRRTGRARSRRSRPKPISWPPPKPGSTPRSPS